MKCVVCGHTEDSNIHAVLEWPLAIHIWKDKCLWAARFRTLRDCNEMVSNALDSDELGNFIAILSECWNTRNHFIFRKPDKNLEVLGPQALTFVKSFKET